jgi:MoaA/NifB/PqqE/SkfB family radical SAM enzyme
MDLESIYRKKIDNLKLSIEEFEAKESNLKSLPSKVIVELTENCNFKCKMCQQSFDDKYKKYNPAFNLSRELFNKIAEQLFPTAYFVDLRGFGETTILPWWPELVDDLEKYPLVNWSVITNLSLSNDKVWKKMIDLGFIIGFSCDAATEETFNSIRLNGNFHSVDKNFKTVVNAIKDTGKGQLYFIVTVQKENIHELPEIVKYASKNGVREVQFKRVRQFDGFLHHEEMITEAQMPLLKEKLSERLDIALDKNINLTMNDIEFTELVNQEKLGSVMDLPTEMGKINFPSESSALQNEVLDAESWRKISEELNAYNRVMENQKCFKPFSFTFISKDGRVGTCNHMMTPDILDMGNLNDDDFEDIWNNFEYRFFRKSLLEAKTNDSG